MGRKGIEDQERDENHQDIDEREKESKQISKEGADPGHFMLMKHNTVAGCATDGIDGKARLVEFIVQKDDAVAMSPDHRLHEAGARRGINIELFCRVVGLLQGRAAYRINRIT